MSAPSEPQCVICQADLGDGSFGDPVTSLLCSHTLHSYCLQCYMDMINETPETVKCPICKLTAAEVRAAGSHLDEEAAAALNFFFPESTTEPASGEAAAAPPVEQEAQANGDAAAAPPNEEYDSSSDTVIAMPSEEEPLVQAPSPKAAPKRKAASVMDRLV